MLIDRHVLPAARGGWALDSIFDGGRRRGDLKILPLPLDLAVLRRVERFGCRATVSFESLNDQNSVEILSEFRKMITFF